MVVMRLMAIKCIINDPKHSMTGFAPTLALCLALCFAVVGSIFAAPSSAADLDLGEEIYEVCAPCHGPLGEGGGGGVYPRLAGMSESYLTLELRRFKSRARENMPMEPFTKERELPDEDLISVAAYIASLELSTHLPKMAEDTDAYVRLQEAKKVLNIPRAPGDPEAGKAVYEEGCVRCHSRTGLGDDKNPLLAGQHTRYLRRQIELFLAGSREHKSVDILFGTLSSADIDNVLAYLSLMDDQLPDNDRDDDDDDD